MTINFSEFKVGEEIKVTLTGTVETGEEREHNSCCKIQDTNGFFHYVYFPSNKYGKGLVVERVETLVGGKAYRDADGDVFIRTCDGKWVDDEGDMRADTYVTRPLTLLGEVAV